ncbi:hypothetical protein BCF74_10640 [Knoellia remsis]|uniref:Uncharacterized protein n=1 Tax=Knoellia remsis TaxID=407159 RepID=A0A2T0UTN6_9MICO|nr:hypothetical protein [Knoellia remsis]PRY61292.1 hypothetical protein BCF74_10640 [Knoellia remsis]
MGGNDLVAGVEDNEIFAGAGIFDSSEQLVRSLGSGDWVSAGLAGLSTGIDAMATASDPFGSLIAAGIGFAMEHFSPLKGWLDDLAGNPGQIIANGQTCENVRKELIRIADSIDELVASDLADQDAPSITQYRSNTRAMTKGFRQQAELVGSLRPGIEGAAALVAVVRSIVRDAIAQVVGALVSYVAELVISLGTATPYIIYQATTRVSALATKVGSKVDELIESCGKLKKLVDGMKKIYQAVKKAGDAWNAKSLMRNGEPVTGVKYHIVPPGAFKNVDPSATAFKDLRLRLAENWGPLAKQHLKDLGFDFLLNKKDILINAGSEGGRTNPRNN